MTERKIMEQIKKLTTAERLTVVEKTLRSIREELEQIEKPVSHTVAPRAEFTRLTEPGIA